MVSKVTYLATTAIATGYRSALTRCRLGWRISHLLPLLVRWRIHLLWRRQGAILIGVIWLQRGHRGRTLVWRGSNARELCSHIVVSMVCRLCIKRWINFCGHVDG